ncbi:MAG: PaaI family thioesterase [Sandaracinaceae bacterium]|nr:PaaI family thioesterase [Sandaracinaceae bacterium]
MSDAAGPDIPTIFGMLKRGFRDAVPHNFALGIELVEVDIAKATMKLPYDLRFVGDPETGVLHGGVITTLIDATCGAAVFAELRAAIAIATLDLRIDYLKPATPGLAVVCRAECYKRTRNVAFARALAYHEDSNDPIASAAGTFMLGTKGSAIPSLKSKP